MAEQTPTPETERSKFVLEKLHEAGVINLDVSIRQILTALQTEGIHRPDLAFICDETIQCFGWFRPDRGELPPENII